MKAMATAGLRESAIRSCEELVVRLELACRTAEKEGLSNLEELTEALQNSKELLLAVKAVNYSDRVLEFVSAGVLLIMKMWLQ